MAQGTLENYDLIDFPQDPTSPLNVHCSTVYYNDRLSVTCSGRVLLKTANKWIVMERGIWQGYFDGEGVNCVDKNRYRIRGEWFSTPIFTQLLRIVPYGGSHILTGVTALGKRMSVVVDGGTVVGEIRVGGLSVYKCNISDNTLWYASPVFRPDGSWPKEAYAISSTINFSIEPL
jgi:hypothetical protein